jgi:hypothetical protein
MTHRRAHVWGAAIIAAGAMLGATAALYAGRPGLLWRPLAIGLVSYVVNAALVLRWGLEVYGPRGALGALSLFSFTPCVLAALAAPPLVAPAGGTTLAGGLAQLVAMYALSRGLLDPALPWILLAGVAILAVPIGAFLHGSPSAVVGGLAAASLLAVVGRVLSADRCESRARVAQASSAAVGLAWALALAGFLIIAAASHLPSPAEYSAAPALHAAEVAAGAADRPSWRPVRRFASRDKGAAGARSERASLMHVAVEEQNTAPTAAANLPPPAPWFAALPFAALLLALMRPWPRRRRFTDASWLAALLCLGVALWVEWGEPGGVFMAPLAALLAGAAWDATRPSWARQAAAFVAALQIVVALLLWPRYPGGVRADAWLPMPGISIGSADPAAGAASPPRVRLALDRRRSSVVNAAYQEMP